MLTELGAGSVQQEAGNPIVLIATNQTGARQGEILDKWQAVTRNGFAAMHHALSRPAKSTSDLIEARAIILAADDAVVVVVVARHALPPRASRARSPIAREIADVADDTWMTHRHHG